MTAMTIIRTLKADRNHLLWIDHELREAALSPAADSVWRPVDYSEACVARTDKSLHVNEIPDGINDISDNEIISAI